MATLHVLVLEQASFHTQIMDNLCRHVAKILLQSYLEQPSPIVVKCVDSFEDYQKFPHFRWKINARFIHIGILLLWSLEKILSWRRGSSRKRLWRRNTLWRMILKRLCSWWILRRRWISLRSRLWRRIMWWRMMLKRLCRWWILGEEA
jgi:hypothetical protein